MNYGGDTHYWSTTYDYYCQETSNDGWRGAKFLIGNSTNIREAKQCG